MSGVALVQYVVVRGDLMQVLKWPLGAVIAQACHACSAVMHLYHDDPNTVTYTSDLDRMHKVVLEAPDEDSLRQLANTLEANNVDYKLWIEQPENIPTCLVTKPYAKQHVQQHFKQFKLLR